MDQNLQQFFSTSDAGFPILLDGMKIHISLWTILLGVLIFTDSLKYIKRFYPKSTTSWYVACSFLALFLVSLSIALHEVAHGLMALALGFQITDAGTMALGVYVRPSVPFYEMAGWQVILICFAGPATNALIALLILLFNGDSEESLKENVIQYVGVINWRLWLLNIFPLFPLDGGKVVFGAIKLFVSNNTHAFTGAVVITILAIAWLFKREEPDRWYQTKMETPKRSKR